VSKVFQALKDKGLKIAEGGIFICLLLLIGRLPMLWHQVLHTPDDNLAVNVSLGEAFANLMSSITDMLFSLSVRPSIGGMKNTWLSALGFIFVSSLLGESAN